MSYSIKHEIPVQDICKLERNQDNEYEVEGGGGGLSWQTQIYPVGLGQVFYFPNIWFIICIFQKSLVLYLLFKCT